MKITAALFAQAGEALFGPEFRAPLADLLGMNERTVRRIAKAAETGEDYPVNETLGPRLAGLLRERSKEATLQAKEADRLAKLLE